MNPRKLSDGIAELQLNLKTLVILSIFEAAVYFKC